MVYISSSSSSGRVRQLRVRCGSEQTVSVLMYDESMHNGDVTM